MAASFARTDHTSPASVAEAGFSTTRRGYQQDEVRAFLTSVAAELGRLQERQRQLESELRDARLSAPQPVELDDETMTNLLGEETLRVLHTARQSATQIRVRAEESAARTMREANDEANKVRQEAEVEAARRRHDAGSESEAELALAKQQGREMVTEARAYRERVLSDLERRTKLARQHIEDLRQGRVRLLQVFERARLVAVDVTSELASIDEPEEYVSFSHTTGPVPLMVPATAMPLSEAVAVIENLETEIEDDVAEFTLADETQAIEVEPEVAEDVPNDEPVGDEPVGDESVEVAQIPRPDGNVVSLFRDRAPIDLITADDPTSTNEVDDIFARLRSEVPTPDPDHTDDQAVVETAPASDDSAELVPATTAFTRRDEALVPLIVSAARKLKRVLADEQNGVLDTLRQKEPVRSLDMLLADLDQHMASYAGALTDELLGAACAGAVELGLSDNKTTRRKLDKSGGVDAAQALLRSGLVGPLRARIERCIADGAGDNEDITKRVRSVYREWKTQHIDDQLDDVFRFAYGGGMSVSTTPGTAMVWTIDPNEPACPDCEDNSLAGAVSAGDSYPTGNTSAPAHPGCRCLMLPVAE
jgi:DivIVA domain-containing protein